jgi:hypothetical protein
MRLPASEKLEIIGLVEQSHLPARRTLQMLGIKPSAFYRTITKIVDLGSGPFDLFFAVMEKIDLVTEARRQLIEPIVLFVADPEAETARTYADLKRRLRSTIFVPVYNEAVSVTFAAQDFLANGIECGPIRIARLSYLVSRVIDRANFSFASYITEIGGESEIHQWGRTNFDKISGTRIATVCEQPDVVFEFGQRKQSTKLRATLSHTRVLQGRDLFPMVDGCLRAVYVQSGYAARGRFLVGTSVITRCR